VAMLFAAAIAGAPPVAAGPGSYSAGNQPRPAERPASPEPLGGCGGFDRGPMTLQWNVIVPTIVVWACAVGLSMLTLLGAGVLAVLGSRWARGVHLVAAGLTLGATIVTLVSLAVLVKYAGAQSWSSARYALVAGVQSGWGWVLLLIFAGRARSGLAGQG
ncbi:MAG: hypothetical protein ACE5K7_03715, partial [Phycisphaerae bacterium]